MTSRFRRLAAELIGTFALVALGPGAAMVAAKTAAFGHSGVALAFGLAVTLGFWSRRRFPGSDVLPYIASQCIGAIAASALLVWVLGPVGNFGATVPALPLAQSFVVELGFTALLGFVIMGVATDDRSPTAVAPFAIGATVFVGALVTGPLTGGSFNPARTLGPAVIGNVWDAHWLYWVAPVAGMVAGMWTYELLRATPVQPTPHEPLGTEGPL